MSKAKSKTTPLKKKSRVIGAHVSASGGHHLALKRAFEIGANGVQLFSSSPRVWAGPNLQNIDLDKISSYRSKYQIDHIYTHALYLINLASDNPQLLEKSMNTLIEELNFDAFIRGKGVVVHLGSHQGRGWEAVKDDLLKILQIVLDRSPADSRLLIENSAGQKGKLCSDLAQVRWLLDRLDIKRVGWCLDTCHAFAAGMSLSSSDQLITSESPDLSCKSLQKQNELFDNELLDHELLDRSSHKKNLHQIITELELWDRLELIHVNDSRDEFASGRDRHANLNEGNISDQDFKWFLSQPETVHIPLVLEVPGSGNGPDAKNVGILKEWVEN